MTKYPTLSINFINKSLPAAIILIALVTSSCDYGVWRTNGEYSTFRPNHSRYKILKHPFVSNNLIDTQFFYLSTKRYDIINDSARIALYGFFGNGQMITTGGLNAKIAHILANTNSFSTAHFAGYYTTKGNQIAFEMFLPGEAGGYETQTGEIKKDTIILSETYILLFKKEVRKDTLIRSPYKLN